MERAIIKRYDRGCGALARVTQEHNWRNKTAGLAFLNALLPFGPFVFEAKAMPKGDSEPT